MKGRQVTGTLERIIKSRNVNMRVKRGIRNSTVIPTCHMLQRHRHEMQYSKHD